MTAIDTENTETLPLPLDVPQDEEQRLRLLEAVLFAASEPMEESVLEQRLSKDGLRQSLEELQRRYAGRGVNLIRIGRRWAFRTAPDLAAHLRVEAESRKKLSRAAIETLAIIAYHQPVTRAEIESIRGVATSKGTLDILMEAGWVRPSRRRDTPGRPLTWVASDGFLDHFGLNSLKDLPGVEELRASGLLDPRPVLATVRPDDSAIEAEEDAGGEE